MSELIVETDVVVESGESSSPETDGEQLVAEELLVEDVSIDGMCGVY